MFIAELHCVHNPVIVLGQVATKWSRIRMESRKENHGWCFHQNWLVVYLSLWKNMKVSWGYYSQHMETNKMSQTTNQVLTFDKQKQLRQVFPTTCWCHIYYGVSLKEQNRAGIPSVWMLPPTTARVFFFFFFGVLGVNMKNPIGHSPSWDDEIPNIWKVIKFMFQTTNQNLCSWRTTLILPNIIV